MKALILAFCLLGQLTEAEMLKQDVDNAKTPEAAAFNAKRKSIREASYEDYEEMNEYWDIVSREGYHAAGRFMMKCNEADMARLKQLKRPDKLVQADKSDDFWKDLLERVKTAEKQRDDLSVRVKRLEIKLEALEKALKLLLD